MSQKLSPHLSLFTIIQKKLYLPLKIQNTIQFESIRERKMPQHKKAKRISIKIKHI